MEKGNGATLFTSAFAGCKKGEIVDGINIARDGRRYSVYWKAGEYYKKYFRSIFDTVVGGINIRPFFIPKFVNNGAKAFALITEANAMGTPAICYKVPWLRDSVKVGETGLACGPNPGAMAERVIELLHFEGGGGAWVSWFL